MGGGGGKGGDNKVTAHNDALTIWFDGFVSSYQEENRTVIISGSLCVQAVQASYYYSAKMEMG